jgi:hypothetical protein
MIFKIINNDKWYGVAATPNAEIHVADRMVDEIQPFALLTGSKTFGNWVQILGSSDTPLIVGKVKYSISKALITTTDSTTAFIIQIVTGESADIAAKIVTENFYEFPHVAATNANDGGIIEIGTPNIVSGKKVWARACCLNESAKTINLYFAIKEFEV